MLDQSKKNIFLIAGRTGGPYFPIPKIISILDNLNPIIIGVKNSFEQKVCVSQNLPIVFLPEAKLNILSFSKVSVIDKIKGMFDLVWNIIKLKISFVICIYQILKFQPKIIYSTGSFLAVPIFLAAKCTNFLKLTNAKLVIHQQDPTVGLSNKICVKMADLRSCSFGYTQNNYQSFQDSFLIQNPILESKFIHETNWKNKELHKFITSANQPKLLIFGGGSGARFINEWTLQNLDSLTKDFDIIHLTGILQNNSANTISHQSYFSLDVVFDDMPQLLKSVDYVLCRAGLGTISELKYLQKKAFLVPLADSHQELNAKLVEDSFVILDQKNNSGWLEMIRNNDSFVGKTFESNQVTQDEEYFKELILLGQD